MLSRFLHIFLLLVCGWLLPSCGASGAPDSPASGAEMRFATSDASSSRSAVTSVLATEGARFAVYADMKAADSPSASNLTLFSGTNVVFSDSRWTYGTVQYWFPDHLHSFAAVYPSSGSGMSGFRFSGSTLTFDFGLPADYTSTPDLLLATHRRMYADGATSPVVFKFFHALARINFLVKCDGAAAKLRFSRISFQGLYRSGSISIAPAPLASGATQTDDYVLAWTVTPTPVTLAAAVDVEVPDGSEVPLLPDSNALFVIPQPGNTGVLVSMDYELVYQNGRTDKRTLTADAPIGGWEQGKVYTYKLTILPDKEEIAMSVTIDDWKAAAPLDDVTVPRK